MSYSLDGEEWSVIGNVGENNWRDSSFGLEIQSWDDLRRLQISVKGLRGAPVVPEIYLDGIRIEVESEQPTWLTDLLRSEDSPLPPPAVEADPEARHRCEVDPFSRSIPRGGSTLFLLRLHPSDANLGYKISFGDVPQGTEPGLIQTTSTEELLLTIDTAPDVERGSVSNVVIYEEIQTSSRRVATFCQYNPIVE
jgi:hypothetical protein